MSNSSSKKFVAISLVFLAFLLPVMEAMFFAPGTSSPSNGASFGPGVPPPDFTISSSPSTLTIAAGSSGSSTISLHSIGGFSGTILLSTPAFPLDSSLDNENVTLTSGSTATATLTVVVPTSTSPDNYTITVSGVSGCSTLHFTDVTVTVTGKDFSVSASKPSLSTLPGGYNSTIISVASKNGFSGLIDLFAFAPGVSTFLSPTPVPLSSDGTVSSNLTIFVPLTTLPGNYTLEVDASSGPLVHFLDIVVSVKGPGFTVSASPLFLEVVAGGSNSSTLTLKPFGGFSGTVTFFNASFPAGLEAGFAPPSVGLPGSTTSLLTVAAPLGLTPGFYDLVVTAFNPSFNATVALPVLVKGPDFAISTSPADISLSVGGSSCSSTVTVTALYGFTGPVTLVNSTFPAGLNVSISTTVISTSGTATINVSAPSTAVPGFYYILIAANSTTTTHYASVTVNVVGPDFKLSASASSLTVTAPPSGTTNVTLTITVSSLKGFTGTVTLAAFIAGVNMTASVSPVNVTSPGPSTLTVGVGSSAESGVFTVFIVGVSGPLSHTTTVDVTVIAPDFSINASPSILTFDTTAVASSTVSIAPLNGFTGSVSLTVFTSSGLNASITPTSVSASGTATLSLNSTVPGTYIVEIDGSSGFLTHFAFVSVTVTGPDFSVNSTPSTLTIPDGSNANSTITLTALKGFSGNVNLTAFTPFGLTASLNASVITPSTTAKLTVTVAPDTPAGTYYVDVVGTSGALTHTAIVVVQVSDFTLSASPPSLTILVGSSRISVITIGSVNGFSGAVTLSASTPSGLTPFLNRTSFTGSGHAQLTITASSSILPGTYLVNVTGTSGSLSHTMTITVVIPVPDFSITAASPVSIYAGATGTSTVTISPISGLSENVTLSFSSSPPGLTCSLSSTTVISASGTSTLSCNGPSGTYTVSVTGISSSAGPHTATVTVTVTDFAISAGPVSPSQKSPTISGSSTITLTGLNGFTGTVGLSVSTSTPSGLTCLPLSSAVFGSSPQTKTLACSASVAGDYTVTVTGTIGSLSHATASILFHVTDFTVTASPTSVSAVAGALASSTITVAPVNSFTGTVALTYSSSPLGLTCTLAPSSLTMGMSQTSALSCSGSTGVYTVTVTGTSGSRALTATVTLTIGDFSVTASPTTLSVATGASATSTITVGFLNGLTGTVSLTKSTSPSTGITCSLTSFSFTSSGTSTLSCIPSTTGTFTVTLTGTSGSLSHTTTFTIASSVPNFTIAANPTTLTIQAGSSGTSTITIAPVNGFTGTVTLTATVANAGLSTALSVSNVAGGSGSSTLTITVDSSTAPATYTVTVQGVSGSLAHNALVNVTVTGPGSSTGSSVLGLPSTTFYGIIVIVIAAVGAALYFMRFHKKAP